MLVIIFGQILSNTGTVIALELYPTGHSFVSLSVTIIVGYTLGSLPMFYAYSKLVPLVVKNV